MRSTLRSIPRSPCAVPHRVLLVGTAAALGLALAPEAGAQQRPRPGAPIVTRAPATRTASTAASDTSRPTAVLTAGRLTPNLARLFVRCCRIVSVDASTGRVIAHDDATGEQFQIGAARRPGSSIAIGRAVPSAANRYRPGQVVYRSLDKSAAALTSYPVSESEQDEIGKSSRKMRTEVVVTVDGQLRAKTRTWTSEALTGFTGGVVVALTDKDGKLLHFTKVRKYGVNGTAVPGAPSSTTKEWSETIPPNILEQFAGIAIVHRYEPTPRWLETTNDVVEFAKYVKDAYQTVAEILECLGALVPEDDSTETGAPEPPPPADGSTRPMPTCGGTTTNPAPGQP